MDDSKAPTPIKVFISYSDRDNELRVELEKHLKPLQRQGKIEPWSKGFIEAGIDWEKETRDAFKAAQIILLLISSDFIASDRCYDKELMDAIERDRDGSARVVPIILRPTALEGTPFDHLQSLPSDQIPLSSQDNRDQAYVDIVQDIRRIAEAFQAIVSNASSSNGTEKDVAEQKPNFWELTQQLRQRCRQKILTQHSRMRLLSGEEIGVDQLYVDVWLLERPENKHFNSSTSLLNYFDIANDRLALSKRINRNPGFEIANTESKLVILGKPGSGKTTFLKHLAIDWCKGKFQSERIAILIELRRIRDESWKLDDAIGKELKLENPSHVSGLLEQGNFLILMDGLDEVPTCKLRQNVQDQLGEVSSKYPNNRFILTCRTQIMEGIPSEFTSVEVADFNQEQVRQFALNWFTSTGQSIDQANKQWKVIHDAAEQQSDLKELTVTPVLLSLMCLVLQDEGEMVKDRAWLYKKAIKLLLSRWNDEKQIDGWVIGIEVYRKLTVDDKDELLTKIAAQKFENPKNFVLFEQDELVKQICEKLNLQNSQEGIAVLKAIEAQHGLMIERADELWSFSHLTFQEHFTVQWLTRLPSDELAKKISNQQWQEVVNQLVKSQQPADRLLKLIKHAIDQSIAQERYVQKFLHWLVQKSESVQSTYKPAAIRALYFSISLDLALALDLALDLDLARDLALDRALALALDRALALARDLARDLARALARALALDLALDRARARARALGRSVNADLKNNLQSLKNALPTSQSKAKLQQWWQMNGPEWIEELRQVMIQHRNIGHDWQFTVEQQNQLQQYYEANKFLVDLMKIEGAVSDDVRDEIENDLLLPWAELHRRHPGRYGDVSSID